jgi:hypothetical protein
MSENAPNTALGAAFTFAKDEWAPVTAACKVSGFSAEMSSDF